MPVIRKNEQFPKRPVIIVIYGSAGVGKTSLANTSRNPLLIDCDKGADRAANRAETTILAKNWDEILQDQNEINNASTVVIDTAKAVLDDFLTSYVIARDKRLETNKLKMYGEIGDHFKRFVSKCREANVDIIIVAHAKEEKDGDLIKFSPDVTGQSKELVLRIADQVGYVSMINGTRTIQFEPNDNRVGKNVAKLDDIQIPNNTLPEFETCMADIIQTVKDEIQVITEEQLKAVEIAQQYQKQIDEVSTADQMNTIVDAVNTLEKKLQSPIKKYMMARAKAIGISINPKTKKFENAAD